MKDSHYEVSPLRGIPGYHLVNSLKKASKLHPGYNLCPTSNAFEQPEQVWVGETEKERKRGIHK